VRRALPALPMWEAAVLACLPHGQFTLGLAIGGLVGTLIYRNIDAPVAQEDTLKTGTLPTRRAGS